MASAATLARRALRPKRYRPLLRDGLVIYPDGTVYRDTNRGYRRVPASVAAAIMEKLPGKWVAR